MLLQSRAVSGSRSPEGVCISHQWERRRLTCSHCRRGEDGTSSSGWPMLVVYYRHGCLCSARRQPDCEPRWHGREVIGKKQSALGEFLPMGGTKPELCCGHRCRAIICCKVAMTMYLHREPCPVLTRDERSSVVAIAAIDDSEPPRAKTLPEKNVPRS
jgi:hypothetical protein